MTEVWQNIVRVYGVLQDDLLLDPALAHALPSRPPVPEIVAIAVIALLSVTLGHATVLLANKVPASRWPVALGAGAVALMVLRALEALLVWGLATLVTGQVVPVLTIVMLMVLSLAPQVLAVIIALPHVGLFLGRLLEAWSLLVMVTLVGELYDVSRWVSLAVAGVAWLVVQVASRLLAEPIRNGGSRWWSRAYGHPTLLTAQDFLSGTPIVPVDARTEVA
ncbi:hypothetical protein [Propioniciclava soli]|uniref:hypothetical protein n=1 Tax=Propioniciclava soli TaxID=2775081 RepID=UPI001E3F3D0F|nr:hypothetical protein [Propioniciclava soli]